MTEEHTPTVESDTTELETSEPTTNSDGLLIASCLIAALVCGVSAFLITYFSSNQQIVGFNTLLIFGFFIFLGIGLLVPMFKNSESVAASVIVAILYVVIAFGLAAFASAIAGWGIYSNSLG